MDFFEAIMGGGLQREMFKSTLPKPPEDMFDKIVNQPKDEVEIQQPSVLEPEVNPLIDRAKAAAEMGISVLNQLNRPYSAVSGGLQEVVREYKKPTKTDEGIGSRLASLAVAPFVGAVKGLVSNDKSFADVMRQIVKGENYNEAINKIDTAISDINKNIISVKTPAEKDALKAKLAELQGIQGKLASMTGIMDVYKTEEGQEALEPLTGGVGQVAYDPLMFGAALLPKTAKGVAAEKIGQESPTIMKQLAEGERSVIGVPVSKAVKAAEGALESSPQWFKDIAGGIGNIKEQAKRMIFNRTDNKQVNDAIETMMQRINKNESDEIVNTIRDAANSLPEGRELKAGDIINYMGQRWHSAGTTEAKSIYNKDYVHSLDRVRTEYISELQKIKNSNLSAMQKEKTFADFKTKNISEDLKNTLINNFGEISETEINKKYNDLLKEADDKVESILQEAKDIPEDQPELWSSIHAKAADTRNLLSKQADDELKRMKEYNSIISFHKNHPEIPMTYERAYKLSLYKDMAPNKGLKDQPAYEILKALDNMKLSSLDKGDISNDAANTLVDLENTVSDDLAYMEKAITEGKPSSVPLNRVGFLINELPSDIQNVILKEIMNKKMAKDNSLVSRNAIINAIKEGGADVGLVLNKDRKIPEGYKVPRLPELNNIALKDKYADFIEQTYEKAINKKITTPIIDSLNTFNNWWKQSVTTGLGLPNFSFSVANTLSEIVKNMQAGVDLGSYKKAIETLYKTERGINSELINLAKRHNIIDTGFTTEDLGKTLTPQTIKEAIFGKTSKNEKFANISFYPATNENSARQLYNDILAEANSPNFEDVLASVIANNKFGNTIDKITKSLSAVWKGKEQLTNLLSNKKDAELSLSEIISTLVKEKKLPKGTTVKTWAQDLLSESYGVPKTEFTDKLGFPKGMKSDILFPVKNSNGIIGKLGIAFNKYILEDPLLSRTLGKYTENTARLANFIDKLDKGYTAEAAARQVAKYNFNYGDISKEMKALKLLYPFITFQLKNVPLQLGQLFENPKTLQMLNRLIEAGTSSIDINDYDENAKKAIPVKIPGVKMDAVAIKRFLPQASTEIAKDIWDVISGQKSPVGTAAEYLSSNLTPLKSIYEASANTTTPGSSVTQTGGGFDSFTGQPIESYAGETGKIISKKAEHVIGNLVPQTKRAVDWYEAITETGKYSPEKQEAQGKTGNPAINKAIQEVTGYRTLPVKPDEAERVESNKLREIQKLKGLLKRYDESGEDNKFNEVEQLLEDVIDSLDENEVLQYKQMEKEEQPKQEVEPFRQSAITPSEETSINPWKSGEMKANPFDEIIMQEKKYKLSI